MQNPIKGISVIGLGKLGAPIAAALASRGYATLGVDIDNQRVNAVNQGTAPVYEPGLQDLMAQAKKRLRATSNIEKAVMNSDVTFIMVSTPSDETGGFSLKYVLETGTKIGSALRQKSSYHLVVLTSTVMPGATGGELKPILETASGKKCGTDFGLCYSPEFVALGSVIQDFLNPDFLLIGESDPRAGQTLESLMKAVCKNNPPVARMNFVNAEITKLSVNTYVTTKITFANTIARICEQLPGADTDAVASALGLDSRIGKKYLKGAIGYGGPCFPRDNLALASLARLLGVPATLTEATDSFNRGQVTWLQSLICRHLSREGKTGILGLAYKPNSDVAEQSQGLLLAQALAGDNFPVIVYDPVAMENARKILGESVAYAKTAEECVKLADVVIITTPWEQFKTIHLDRISFDKKRRTMIDCWRLLDASQYAQIFHYIPLGIGPKELHGKSNERLSLR